MIARAASIAGGLAAGALALAALIDASVEVRRGQVSAPVVTLRAPADGELRRDQAGQLVAPGERLGHVRAGPADPALRRAEAARVAALRADLTRVDIASRAVADARAAYAERAAAERAARLRLAEARLAEADAILEAAEGRRREAEAALSRAASLAADGVGTEADIARIRVAVEIASQEAETARNRVLLARHERDAARDGLLPADPAGRMPEAERAMRDLALRSGELAAEAAGLRAAITAAEAALHALDAGATATAPLLSPSAGRVVAWIEAEGAPVTRGQPLVRLALCDAAAIALPALDGRTSGARPGQLVRVRLHAPDATVRTGRVVPSAEPGSLRVAVDGLEGCPLGVSAEIAFGARPFDAFRR